MFEATFPAGRAVIDMAVVAREFGLGTDEFLNALRTGIVSRWIELGTGDSDNKPRHVFASPSLGLRVDVDEVGNVHPARKYGRAGRGAAEKQEDTHV